MRSHRLPRRAVTALRVGRRMATRSPSARRSVMADDLPNKIEEITAGEQVSVDRSCRCCGTVPRFVSDQEAGRWVDVELANRIQNHPRSWLSAVTLQPVQG